MGCMATGLLVVKNIWAVIFTDGAIVIFAVHVNHVASNIRVSFATKDTDTQLLTHLRVELPRLFQPTFLSQLPSSPMHNISTRASRTTHIGA
eukprot:2314805-Rhodomonas_salina.2